MLTSVAPCSRQPVAPTACLLLSRVQRDSSLAAWRGGGKGGRGGRGEGGREGGREGGGRGEGGRGDSGRRGDSGERGERGTST